MPVPGFVHDANDRTTYGEDVRGQIQQMDDAASMTLLRPLLRLEIGDRGATDSSAVGVHEEGNVDGGIRE